MALNTSDGFVNLIDNYPSQMYTSPQVTYQIDRDGKLVPTRDTYSYNRDNHRISNDPNRQRDSSINGIYKTYQQPTMSSELKSRLRPSDLALYKGTSSKKLTAAAPIAVEKIPVN